jgi:hypothetical protein
MIHLLSDESSNGQWVAYYATNDIEVVENHKQRGFAAWQWDFPSISTILGHTDIVAGLAPVTLGPTRHSISILESQRANRNHFAYLSIPLLRVFGPSI